MKISVPEVLSQELFTQYQSVCHNHLSHPPKQFIPNLLGNYCIQGIIFQAHFYYNNQAIFEFGCKLLPESFLKPNFSSEYIQKNTTPETPDLPRGLSLVRRWYAHEDQILVVCLVTLKPLKRMCTNLLDYEIYPITKSWYYNRPLNQQNRVLNQSAIFHQFLSSIVPQSLGVGSPVTLSHFHFQELKVYLEVTGEQQTKDFLRELIQILRQNLKKTDYVIQLSPVSYLILSPGATKQIMTNRFKHIYFMIHSLVLEYKLDIFTITKLPMAMNDIWKELKI